MFDIFNMLKKEEHKDAKQVTRETIIGDILDMDQTTAPYFMEIGMHCLGCPASRGESIEEACAVHGVDCDELIEKLKHAGCKDRAELRLGDGLSVLTENEVGSIVLAGVSAQTTWEILEKAPWVFTVGGPRIIMIPATRHDALRRWLWEHGFSFAADRPVQAAGRWYAVMAAEYTGRVYAPTFAECLFGSTGEWPEGKGYADWQKAKLPRMRLGVPDGSELAAEIDAILKEGTEG